ncbi:MAG: D-alanine--D-alanine ligase [Verrucomicrobiota bacterium]
MILEGNKIAVLRGGPGSEREVSLASGASVLKALQSIGGLEVVDVDVRSESFDLPVGTDLAFNVIHGTFGEDGALQELLEAKGVAYTGAGVTSSRLAFDKTDSKHRFIEAGVPTAPFEMWDLGRKERPEMALPVCVKPPREGSSVGVHLVRTEEELAAAREDLKRFGQDALVESLIVGKELTVGVLDQEAFPIVHIQPRSGFYDMKNKYPWLNQKEGETPSTDTGSDYFVPAELPADLTQSIHEAALAAHRSLGVEIYSRVDFLLNESGEAFALEVNTIPGMTETSLLPKAAQAAGIGFPQLCLRIAELSWAMRK